MKEILKELDIDIGDGSCVAKCAHCKHGMLDQQATAVFTDETVLMYKRLEDYALREQVSLRVAYANPLSALPDQPFYTQADTLSFPFRSFSELLDNKAMVTKKIASYCKDNPNLSVIQLSIHLDSLDQATDLLLDIISLQIDLVGLVGNKQISVGFNNNTCGEDWEKLQTDMTMLSLLYLKWIQKMSKDKIEWTEILVARVAWGISFSARAKLKAISFSCSGRFIDTVSHKKARPALCTLSDFEKNLPLALFPWGVHVDHSTININDHSLKFSYEEFGALLDLAISRKRWLKEICWEAVSERRKHLIPIVST